MQVASSGPGGNAVPGFSFGARQNHKKRRPSALKPSGESVGAKRAKIVDDRSKSRQKPRKKKLHNTGRVCLSFGDEVSNLCGEVFVVTADGFTLRIPHDVVAVSPLLREHATLHVGSPDPVSLRLTNPDCTRDCVRQVICAVRPAASGMEDLPSLVWPSYAAWSFLRCAAHIGATAAIDVAAACAGGVLARFCLLHNRKSLEDTFGKSPEGGLFGRLLDEHPDIAEVRCFFYTCDVLGDSGADVAAAALTHIAESPLLGVSAEVLITVLQHADDVLLRSSELQAIIETSTKDIASMREQLSETESCVDAGRIAEENLDTLTADRRFAGSPLISLIVAEFFVSSKVEALPEVLTRAEKQVSQGHAHAASVIARWLASALRMQDGRLAWSLLERALVLLLKAAKMHGHPDKVKSIVGSSLETQEAHVSSWRAAAAAVFADTAAALAECLRSEGQWTMHKIAVAAAPIYAHHCGEAVVAAVIRRFDDLDEEGRLHGLLVLERFALRGDWAALETLTPCFEDSSMQVRERAVCAWRAVAVKGDTKCLQIARRWMDSDVPKFRALAASLLFAVALPGDGAAMSDMVGLLKAKEPQVRDAALDELVNAPGRGYPCELTAAVRDLLKHGNWAVRQRAMGVFARMTPLDDASAVEALAARLEDSAPAVRGEVPSALEALVDGARGNDAVVRAVRERLSARKAWPARQAAVAALGRTASFLDEAILKEMAGLVSDEANGVRETAIVALELLLGPDSQNAAERTRCVDLVTRLAANALKSRDQAVRVSGIKALASISSCRGGDALEAVKKRLDDPSWTVRKEAVSAVCRMARKEDATSMTELVATKLEDANDAVRGAAAHGLVTLAGAVAAENAAGQPGTKEVGNCKNCLGIGLKEARRRLDHSGRGVRRAAAIAVERLEALLGQLVKTEVKNEVVDGACVKVHAVTLPGMIEVKAEEDTNPNVLDPVGSGLREFLKSARTKEKPPASTDDAVTAGLKNFLRNLKRQWGPVSALRPRGVAEHVGTEVVAFGEHFRPPQPDDECLTNQTMDESSTRAVVKEETLEEEHASAGDDIAENADCGESSNEESDDVRSNASVSSPSCGSDSPSGRSNLSHSVSRSRGPPQASDLNALQLRSVSQVRRGHSESSRLNDRRLQSASRIRGETRHSDSRTGNFSADRWEAGSDHSSDIEQQKRPLSTDMPDASTSEALPAWAPVNFVRVAAGFGGGTPIQSAKVEPETTAECQTPCHDASGSVVDDAEPFSKVDSAIRTPSESEYRGNSVGGEFEPCWEE